MYRLFLDVGNTNIVLGLYQDETLQDTGRIMSDAQKTTDDYTVEIAAFLQTQNIAFADLSDFVIASVVPQLTETLRAVWQDQQGKEPFIIHAGLKTNLQQSLTPENASTVGADLIAGAVAAHDAYPDKTVIIVDMGTATTMMVVDAAGIFYGGAIAAGMTLMLHALIDNAALLSFTGDVADTKVKAIGTSTEAAIQSGIIYGYTGLVDNIIEKIIAELQTDNYQVVATGGLVPTISNYSKYLSDFDPHLVLTGMQLIYQLNT